MRFGFIAQNLHVLYQQALELTHAMSGLRVRGDSQNSASSQSALIGVKLKRVRHPGEGRDPWFWQTRCF
jgi:hypothetical protein